MKKLLMGFGILAALITPSLSTNAFACSCSLQTIGESFSQADAVFSGRVVSANPFTARIQVDTVWKGVTRSEITMQTGNVDLGNGNIRERSCAYSYTAGMSYIIFAGGAPDKLNTSICYGTAVASAEQARNLDALVRPKRVGDEIRSCSGTNEIRIATATPDSKALSAVTLTAEGSGKKYGAITDQSGNSIFTGLQSGEYKITASADGYLARQSTVTVAANDCVEASLYLLPIAK